MWKVVLDTQVSDILKPRSCSRLGFNEYFNSHCINGVISEVANHREKRQLAEMEESRPRERASQEVDYTV